MGSLDLSVLGGHQLPSVTSDPVAEQEECPGTGLGFIPLHRLGWAVNPLRRWEKDIQQLQHLSMGSNFILVVPQGKVEKNSGGLTRNPKRLEKKFLVKFWVLKWLPTWKRSVDRNCYPFSCANVETPSASL